jgi:integrase
MARIFQDTKQKRNLGEKAPWYVEWRHDGKRCSEKVGAKTLAKRVMRLKEVEITEGGFGLLIKKLWREFREEYEQKILPQMPSPRSRTEVGYVLNNFEKVAAPKWVRFINRKMLDEFVAKRLQMRGKKKGDTISPETVKKELRTLRACLRCAVEWHYLPEVPSMPKFGSFQHDKRFVSEQHFEEMLLVLDTATMRLPSDLSCSAERWWRTLLIIAWVTGMRIGALLNLRWEDVNFEEDWVVSRAEHNKSKRDHRHSIYAARDVLRSLHEARAPSEPRVFPWNHDRTTLGNEFAKLQKTAGIHLPCSGNHTHTAKCHVYGFHDIRRSHATFNYGRVTDAELQEQMGHASFQTTRQYIKYAKLHQHRPYNAFLPAALQPTGT